MFSNGLQNEYIGLDYIDQLSGRQLHVFYCIVALLENGLGKGVLCSECNADSQYFKTPEK